MYMIITKKEVMKQNTYDLKVTLDAIATKRKRNNFE